MGRYVWRLAGHANSNGCATAEPNIVSGQSDEAATHTDLCASRRVKTLTHVTAGMHVGCVRQLSMLAAAGADHHNSRLHSLQRPATCMVRQQPCTTCICAVSDRVNMLQHCCGRHTSAQMPDGHHCTQTVQQRMQKHTSVWYQVAEPTEHMTTTLHSQTQHTTACTVTNHAEDVMHFFLFPSLYAI
jgi:hypothetical protein